MFMASRSTCSQHLSCARSLGHRKSSMTSRVNCQTSGSPTLALACPFAWVVDVCESFCRARRWRVNSPRERVSGPLHTHQLSSSISLGCHSTLQMATSTRHSVTLSARSIRRDWLAPLVAHSQDFHSLRLVDSHRMQLLATAKMRMRDCARHRCRSGMLRTMPLADGRRLLRAMRSWIMRETRVDPSSLRSIKSLAVMANTHTSPSFVLTSMDLVN